RHTRSKRDWSSDVCSSDLSKLRKNARLLWKRNSPKTPLRRLLLARRLKRSPWKTSIIPQQWTSSIFERIGESHAKVTSQSIDFVSKQQFFSVGRVSAVPVPIFEKSTVPTYNRSKNA